MEFPGGGAPKQILVVDDIATNRKLLRVILELQGYGVQDAADGVEALALLERSPVDAVISDILMPTMDGYRLCHEIRQSQRWRALPFIFYSSTYRSASDEKLALEMGGDKFLVKPASAEAILGALREALSVERAQGAPELTVHGELGLMKQYSARLVSKLEEQNTELYHRTLALEYEITERERADLALREREHQLRLFVEHSPAAIAMFDREMRYLVASHRYRSDYGLGERDLAGQSHYEIFPEMPERWKEIHRRCLAGAVERADEDRFERAGGSVDWVRWEIRPWSDSDGAIGGVILFSEVITERKQHELERQQSAVRMQALARRLVETREAEQRWLSAELHDRVGQTLTALGLNLDIVAGALPPEIAEKIASRLHDSRVLVDSVMGSVRELIAELRPAALDDFGLLAGLRWFGEQIRGRSPLQLEIRGQEPAPRLEPRIEGALFRIAQEAVNNTIKHAGARCATVELSSRPECWVLTVADDGKGFDPARPAKPDANSHWGLEMMRERAEAVGARFQVESSGSGTRIVIEVARPR